MIQYVIFIYENIDFSKIIKKIDDIKLNKIDIQINIIEFNIKSNFDKFEKYNINYVYLNTIDTFKKYKFNKMLSYNIIINIFTKYLFNYKYVLFDSIDSIDYINFNELISKIKNYQFIYSYNSFIFIDKITVEKVGYFDPELFIDEVSKNSFTDINYFIEKAKKVSCYYEYSKNIINSIEYYDIFLKLDDNNSNILLNFLKNRNNLQYNIASFIKTFFINLDERVDRLNDCLTTFKKIDLENYERFPGIKPNIDEVKNYLIDNNPLTNYPKFINPLKLWKKNNIEYLRGVIGCKLSHLEILKYADADANVNIDSDTKILKRTMINSRYIMILEDDILFDNNSLIYLEMALNDLKNIEWDILYLTINLKKNEDAVKISNNLLQIKKGLTTTGQIFQVKDIKKIISIIENSECEIDNTYNDLLPNKFCVYPMLAYQKESWSDINKENMNYGNFHKKYTYL